MDGLPVAGDLSWRIMFGLERALGIGLSQLGRATEDEARSAD
jgi:hypothetical protein